MTKRDGGASHGRSPKRHTTLFFSIAVTFMVICVLLALTSMISLELGARTFQQEHTRVGLSTAEASTQLVRNQINEYMSLCDLISANEKIPEVMELLEENQSAWITEALTLRSMLLSAQVNFGDASLQEFLVFYPERKAIVSSKMIFMESNIDFFATQHETTVSFLETLPAEKYGICKTDDNLCWITRSIFRRGEVYAYVLLGFQPDNLFSRCFAPEDHLRLLVNGRALYSSVNLPDEEIPAGTETDTVQIGEGSYYPASERINGLDLDIAGLVSAEEDIQSVHAFRARGRFQILTALLVILGLGLVFTYHIYLPIRRLLTDARVMDKATSVTNAMETVSGRLQSLSEEKKQYQESLQASDYLVQGNRLQHLLKLPKEQAEEAFRAFLEECPSVVDPVLCRRQSVFQVNDMESRGTLVKEVFP